ncbi:MAG: ADP-glyceromanno-heptose 6-epimerase [Bacteroidia bacterium]|nr:ADP-glyceromanno-heptose 6-epimerase [Bacteroidia bacterium]
MILVTGAAGFIGSYVASGLYKAGYRELILSDDFSREAQKANYASLSDQLFIDRKDLIGKLDELGNKISYVIHLGARTDTAEQDWGIFQELNLSFSKAIWDFCVKNDIPLIYASSAATYGDGSLGFSDQLDLIPQLKPLNPYGQSKQDFDLWALNQEEKPPRWAGLKFFNVYGPNEYHKGRMASVILHAHKQILETGKLRLFRSHKEGYADGEQKRDFIYVKDILDVILFLMKQEQLADIFNLGCGQARTFNDLASAIFRAMEKERLLEYFDTPIDIRDSYQYFTQADMSKLKKAGYDKAFTRLEEGVFDYVRYFLTEKNYF